MVYFHGQMFDGCNQKSICQGIFFEPAAKRIQVQIQFGYNFTFLDISLILPIIRDLKMHA